MLVNEQLAGKTVATSFGDIFFNENGEAVDIKPEVEKALEHVQGFYLIEDAKPEPKEKAPAKKAVPKKAATKEEK